MKLSHLFLALTCKELGHCHFHPYNNRKLDTMEKKVAFLQPVRELKSQANCPSQTWQDRWTPRVTAEIGLLGTESARAMKCRSTSVVIVINHWRWVWIHLRMSGLMECCVLGAPKLSWVWPPGHTPGRFSWLRTKKDTLMALPGAGEK